jgi:hypothetical protein
MVKRVSKGGNSLNDDKKNLEETGLSLIELLPVKFRDGLKIT